MKDKDDGLLGSTALATTGTERHDVDSVHMSLLALRMLVDATWHCAQRAAHKATQTPVALSPNDRVIEAENELVEIEERLHQLKERLTFERVEGFTDFDIGYIDAARQLIECCIGFDDDEQRERDTRRAGERLARVFKAKQIAVDGGCSSPSDTVEPSKAEGNHS